MDYFVERYITRSRRGRAPDAALRAPGRSRRGRGAPAVAPRRVAFAATALLLATLGTTITPAPARAAGTVYVSPKGSDTAPGTQAQPLRTLAAGVAAGRTRGARVLAASGTYAERLRLVTGVNVSGGYNSSTWTPSAVPTRITGQVTATGDTEAALAINVKTLVRLERVTLAPIRPTRFGASSYGLRGINSNGLRLNSVTVVAAPGAPAAAQPDLPPAQPAGNGLPGDSFVGGSGGSSPVERTGGSGGQGGFESSGDDGRPGQSTVPDAQGRMGGAGGPGGQGGGDHTMGGRGYLGDSGFFQGDGAGAEPGNSAYNTGRWLGRSGHPGRSGTDGHGGGGGGGGGSDSCWLWCDNAGGGGGGGGGGQGGFGGLPGVPGGGSFAIFLASSSGAIVGNSTLVAGDGGAGGAGGGGGLGGDGGLGGPAGSSTGGNASDGGDGGMGGGGGRGGDGGGGAGGPSVAVLGLTPAATPGTTVHHGAGGLGGAGGVGAGNGGGRGVDGAAASYRRDAP